MDSYLRQISSELRAWQEQMMRKPSFFNNLSKKVQTKVNRWIPEKIHKAITVAIKQMIRGVLFGARHTTAQPFLNASVQTRERLVLDKVDVYRKTAAIEGGITGAAGILIGLADFPILIGIKIKLLFDIATLYGFNVHLSLIHISEP